MGRTLMVWEPFDRYNVSAGPTEADAWAIRRDAEVVSKLLDESLLAAASAPEFQAWTDEVFGSADGIRLLTKAARRSRLPADVQKEIAKAAD